MKITLKLLHAFFLAAVAAFSTASSVHAGPNFEAAKITFIQHDVAVADLQIAEFNADGSLKRTDATLNQSLSPNNAVLTGKKSRAELLLNDGTLTRLGQLTSFTFKQGTRDIDIKQGSALFVVPKGLGGTRIQAGAVTAAITGTTLLVQVLNDTVVIFVYEGSVQVGDKVIRTGQVLSVPNNGSAVTLAAFNLARAIDTSSLFAKFNEAESQAYIMRILRPFLNEYLQTAHNDLLDKAVLPPLSNREVQRFENFDNFDNFDTPLPPSPNSPNNPPSTP
jgi:hypothetical protein